MSSLKRHEELERQLEQTHEQFVSEKLNCAERTFLAIRSILNTDIPFKTVTLLTGLGGGIGGTHESVCGAVSGGVAALGLVWGRRQPNHESREMAYEVARDFFSRFRSQFGTEVCGQLIGDLLRVNKFNSDERKARCNNYTLHALKMCLDILSKYEKL